MKVVIVGGGVAGWLAALFIGKTHQCDITVVASSEIGTVGAGEAVTGAFIDVLSGYYGDFGLNPLEFFKEASAVPKYGILHKDWTSKKGFDYFAPIDGSVTSDNVPDIITAYFAASQPDRAHLGSFYGNLFEHNISPINKFTNNYDIGTSALHFDAKLAGEYLRKKALALPNINLFDEKIIDVNINDYGEVSSLYLESGQVVEGDFFIDASGFRRILVNKLKTPWVSYKKNLPIDSALPFFLNYKEGETPKPYSVAWAQKAGWLWEAGVQTRKGCGYVFSSDFITAEQAKQEIEETLGHEIVPINHFKFDTGRLENTWVKNCLAIGLCGAFAEPLEATSIHSTIHQLSQFTFEFLRPTREDTINPSSMKIYNQRINKMFDDFKEFLICHYLGGRTDSEFWKYITNGNTLTDFNLDLNRSCCSRIPNNHDFPKYPGAAGWPIWSYILIGTGQISPSVAKQYLTQESEVWVSDNLNNLNALVDKLKKTHYSLDEYWKIINKGNFSFIPS